MSNQKFAFGEEKDEKTNLIATVKFLYPRAGGCSFEKIFNKKEKIFLNKNVYCLYMLCLYRVFILLKC